jgi:transcription-repair coupling factor (superfamily II helicase)
MNKIDTLLAASQPLLLSSVPEGYLPWLLQDVLRAHSQAVFIARDDAQAALIADTMAMLFASAEIIHLPAWDCLPYDRASPSPRISAERLTALHALCAAPQSKRLLITTINAVLQRLVPRDTIMRMVQKLEVGSTIDRDSLATLLTLNGYCRVDSVAEQGDFAVRGSLIDLFPAGSEQAIRLDFFGDDIESIRSFDPHDQRSTGTLTEFLLRPVSETPLDADSIKRFRQNYIALFGGGVSADPLYQSISEARRFSGQEHWLPLFNDRLVTLFEDYVPSDACIVMDSQVPAAATARLEMIADHYGARAEIVAADKGASYKPLAADALYLGSDEWDTAVTRHKMHATSIFAATGAHVLDFEVRPARDFAPERQTALAQGGSVFDALRDFLKSRTAKPMLLLCYSDGSRTRINGLLAEHGVKHALLLNTVSEIEVLAAGSFGLALLPIESGFESDALCVLTEQDVLGDRIVRRRKSGRRADNFIQELSALTPGDLVVHFDHGIGRYEGLQAIDVGGAPHDCVSLTYAGGDKLYVPVENIDVLTRYGSDGDSIQLDKLGGVGWQSRKAKLKERIQAIAAELLKVAAARKLKEAPAFHPQAGSYEEFCARFPYAETDDQLKVISDVTEDLGSGRPMDRLVCGDVGFGKTEVALRAAVIAAMEGVQVALVCPTTLLARQHAITFTQRFSGLPLQIAQLSRLVGSVEAKRVNAGLADGSVDIVIGTHALLAKAIRFKRLGLVIVDEEQHFGVAHKERLKQLKEDVHVLTLTATPIPRTLQMALTGLRELSVIATPPIDRLAVRTYVMPWDPLTIREALLREHFRGGQSFYVCPRIADLAEAEEFLKTHVPEVKAVMAHGQMAPGDIEERMTAFYDRKYDVLLATSIIESGLDIPTANTLIIHRADMFGLAQLYQLRGRVGRSKLRGYAYLTTPASKALTQTAEKRLNVLSSLDGLGAGFQLASHDLDIRGAGNLLGDEQSGHIREIGFELYQNMLEEALLAARAEAAGMKMKEDAGSPQISVGASILIPDTYVPDLGLRMGLYRRLSDIGNRADIESFAAELIDRFGALPQELQNLLLVIETKLYCRIAEIAKIEAGPRGAIVTFANGGFSNIEGLVQFLGRYKNIAKLRPDNKLVFGQAWQSADQRLQGVLNLSKGLARVAKNKVVQAA